MWRAASELLVLERQVAAAGPQIRGLPTPAQESRKQGAARQQRGSRTHLSSQVPARDPGPGPRPNAGCGGDRQWWWASHGGWGSASSLSSAIPTLPMLYANHHETSPHYQEGGCFLEESITGVLLGASGPVGYRLLFCHFKSNVFTSPGIESGRVPMGTDGQQ